MAFIARSDAAVAKLAARQHGAFTRSQARSSGLTPSQIRARIRRGAYLRALPGVYRFAAAPVTERQQLWAALLWAGPGAAVSHRSAATCWGLDVRSPGRPELLVPIARAPRHATVRVHRSTDLAPTDVTARDGLVVTTPVRTVIDLAAVVGGEDLEVALESARRLRLVAPEAVLRRLDELGTRGRAGAAVLRPLLEAARTRPALESRLEVKVARLLRGAGLPEPERQWKVSVGGRRYRLDFAWPSRRVALEADGRASHATPRAFQRDRTRWTLLASAGWRVMVVTWEDATRRAREVVDQVSAALRIPS